MMSIYLKFVELTADVLEIFFIKYFVVRKSMYVPLSSGCWVSGREVLLSNCKCGFPVSRIVLTAGCVALTEEKMLRPSPGTNMARFEQEHAGQSGR